MHPIREKLVPVFVAVALAAAPALAVAEDGGPFADSNFSGSVTFATDYVWRGISQTDSTPAIQGSVDYATPFGVYAGAWASNVKFGGSIEIDWYAGFANEIGDTGLSYDVGANYYSYPKSNDDPEINFVELYASFAYGLSLGAVEPSVALGYNFSPDFFGEDGVGHYLNASAGVGLPLGFGLGGEIGYQTVEGDESTGNGGGLDGDDGFDYLHWRLGVSYSIKGFDLDLSYHDTNEEDFLGDDIADARVVFSVSRAL